MRELLSFLVVVFCLLGLIRGLEDLRQVFKKQKPVRYALVSLLGVPLIGLVGMLLLESWFS
ncbi:hypothetical protein [Deinococcus enclensis]|uniref:Uncharacterized protein n=1 Tax=Deinococcus enclensis TaxID=1049582 RepID=A0ABT9MB93_9DEIO|nr:hypothetical protein [Deinococcus enclensis]MDP9763858.1 hypothetical protein [Deinococcus enclensis]